MKRLLTALIITVTVFSAFAFGGGKYFNKGVKALNAGNLQAAKVFFNEALNEDPKFSRAYSYLAYTQTKLGETDNAIMNYKLAYKFDRKDYSSLTNLCQLYLDKGDLRGAYEACTRSLSIKPDSYKALNNRCYVFLQAKRYPSAIADCSQAISVKHDYATAYVNRGMAYMALKQYDKAVSDFESALLNNPADATAYNNRCTAYKELKEYKKALADCSKAIALDATLTEAYLNRADLYQQMGQNNYAAADYAQYLRYHPDAETVRQKMLGLIKEKK